MRESTIEKALTDGVTALGGQCEKFVSPGKRGVPDRLVTLPKPIGMVLVETKAPDGTLEPWQDRDHARRRALGVTVAVVWELSHVEELIKGWERRLAARRLSRW